MKKLISFIVLSTLITGSFVSCKKGSVSPKSEEEKTLYVMGAMLFGNRLKTLQLTEGESEILIQGIRDSLKKDGKLQVEVAQYAPKVREFIQGRSQKIVDDQKKKGADFLENFVKSEKAQKSESGLAYKIISAGDGNKPKASDIVKVKYKGQLINGDVFDENKEGIELPLNRVIKGWTEGLQMIGVGGKIKLVIPSEIGYGDFGAPPKIPGGATLVFDVELMEFKENKPAKKK